MVRDLTESFLSNIDLRYPVKVFHEKIPQKEKIDDEAIVFLLNPGKIDQNDLLPLLKNNACYIFFKDSLKSKYEIEHHALRMLLSDRNVNKYLERIKGLNRNIIELYTEKNRWWDVLGISASYKQLFSIKDTGFCFVEYPIITKDILNLDDIIVQDIAKSSSPVDIIRRYLQYIENSSRSELDAIHIRNALQKVFRFYKSESDEYVFNLNTEDVNFLVDVLHLNDLLNDPIKRASIIGALTAACAYFVHSGYPESYCQIIDKLIKIESGSGEKALKYKHIDNSSLSQLKDRDAFLYYHLTCRIPNQYLIALFDMFLITSDKSQITKYDLYINSLMQYLENKAKELLIMPEGLIWGFKRDQEIGAMAGTIGQIILYKEAVMEGNTNKIDDAEKYFKMAIEYVHPNEKDRDVNYFIHSKLIRIVQIYCQRGENQSCESEMHEMAKMIGQRFLHKEKYNPFDIMISLEIIAVANVILSRDKSEDLYRVIGIDSNKVYASILENKYLYASYLLVSYLYFTPKKILECLPDISKLTELAESFFKLNDRTNNTKGIIDVIAIKFMMGHVYYLNVIGEIDEEKLNGYKKRIADTVKDSKWSEGYLRYIDDCINKKGTEIDGLKLIYTIPY